MFFLQHPYPKLHPNPNPNPKHCPYPDLYPNATQTPKQSGYALVKEGGGVETAVKHSPKQLSRAFILQMCAHDSTSAGQPVHKKVEHDKDCSLISAKKETRSESLSDVR